MIVLSGANIQFGGPLQIFKDVLTYLNSDYPNQKIVALVNNAELFPVFENVEYIEIPLYKKIIVFKFYYEYIWYYFLSKKLKPALWLSLNDCTPTVKAKTRAVYCHNATPFYPRSFKDFLSPNRTFLQSFYYEIFYRVNILKNNYVIVQQLWLKKYFEKRFKLKKNKIIINPFSTPASPPLVPKPDVAQKNYFGFIYPTKALAYKNLEVIFEAASAIENTGTKTFRVYVTINGTENSYAKHLFLKYKDVESIVWLGSLSREELEKYYAISDCLLFSSKLETWGLPISEFKKYNRPIITADLPYAHETIGDYPYAIFFNPDKYNELKTYMLRLLNKEFVQFDLGTKIVYEKPFAPNWRDLFRMLLRH